MPRHVEIAGRTRHLAGWRRSPRRARLAAHPALEAMTSALPPRAAIDFSGLPVFDQAAVGDCTAHMGCEQMGFLELKAGRAFIEFSRLFLYAITRQLEGTPLSEDSGAEIHDVMTALAQTGVCVDAAWPTGNGSDYFVEPGEAAKSDALNHQALFFYHCPTMATVKASIVQGFPVGFGFSVPANMQTDMVARSGEVRYPAAGEEIVGGHAVVAIAYDDRKLIGSDMGAVRCRNSWSADWGLNGDFWLPQRFFLEGMADDCWSLRSIEL